MEKIIFLQKIADNLYDGHFTIMKFTTNWRVSFGHTPNDRDLIHQMPVGKTFDEAVDNAILTVIKDKLCN